MRNRIFISTLLLTFLLTSCDDLQPDISFDSPFPKRNKNLQWKLGDQFSILKNNDTITYRITFNHTDRENYIINNNTNDTIFAGIVSKYRGLYYFNHQINDTTYWISAVDIDKDIFNMHNTIRGLGTAFQQMLLLNNEIEQGNLKKLIKYNDPDKNIIRLHPDKKILHDYYSSIIESFPADTLVDLTTDQEPTENTTDTLQFKELQDTPETAVDFEEYEIIKNVYPNPTKDHCNIELYKTNQYHFDLVDNSGKLVHRGQFTNRTNKIDLTDFQTGIYILRVYTADKNDIETVSIIKNE